MRKAEDEWIDDNGAAQATGASDSVSSAGRAFPPLTEILAALPFGLEVKAEDGTLAFSNRKQQGTNAPELTTRIFDFDDAGRHYSVALDLDETERTAREQALIRRAYFDELTGLPNRRVIEQSVQALIGDGSPFALAFIDVDGFKHVNDFYGHNVGDGLLVQISERISSGLSPSDMLARLSGDEFMLLISPLGGPDAVRADIHQLSQRLRQPFYVDGNEIFSSASIGVCLYPLDGQNYDTLRANADRAMYRGKGNGSGSVQFFDVSIEHAAMEKSRLEQRLRLAIRDKRVSCAYQPKIDIHSETVSGVEVLLRWTDEDGVIQPPGEFIALAIELGLMDDLTFQVLDRTIRSIDLINEAFGPAVTISLNVAAKQAGDPKFMRSLLDRITATNLASRFILEITEEAFVSKSTFQRDILPLIREIGARVSIDDFGVGYSSLAALADITADEVKIDRSFITDVHKRPRSQNILKAVEALSRSLGMNIIVEGVETFEELAYLRTCTSIRYAQGFYYSRPIMLEDLGGGSVIEDSRNMQASRQPMATRQSALRG